MKENYVKNDKNMISTHKLCAKHPSTGQNTQRTVAKYILDDLDYEKNHNFDWSFFHLWFQNFTQSAQSSYFSKKEISWTFLFIDEAFKLGWLS